MGHYRNNDDFNDFTLPTFLDNENYVDNNQLIDKDLVIDIPEGSFTLDYNILIHQHNVIIKGQGSNKTTLIVPININRIVDGMIELLGAEGEEISVSISGLTLNASVTKQQADVASVPLTSNETHLIKCYHVKSFLMHDVRIVAENLETTCLDIRRGSNIEIRDNVFISNNRRTTGGGIWMRGDIENVIIEDNDFYKYGNDEVIGLYGSNNFVGSNASDEISKKNVMIRHNRFFCQDNNGGENLSGIIDEGDGTWHGCNERFITVFTNQDDNTEIINNVPVPRSTPCHQTVNGIHLCNNEFHINAPMSHLFTAAFDKYTTFKDITIRNNVIEYGNWTLDEINTTGKELIDFGIYYDIIYDSTVIEGNYDGVSDEPFFITGNTIRCGTNARTFNTNNNIQYYVDNHTIVDYKGTKVYFNDNKVVCTREAYTIDEQNFANKGVILFRTSKKGGEIIFNHNHCEGLRALCINAHSSVLIPECRLWGCGNYLQGNTRIIQTKVVDSHVFLSNNEIICDYPIFFLEEFADTGTAVFTGNRVYRDLSRVTRFTTPFGHIYYTGTSGPNNNIQSMRLISCDNVFDNLNVQYMYSYLQSQTMRTVHKNNIFVDDYE